MRNKPEMIGAAPKVEAATAAAAVPAAYPDAEPAEASEHALASIAPNVGAAYASPPTSERGSLMTDASVEVRHGDTASSKLNVETLRATHKVTFEAPAAVINGPAEKNLCQQLFPCILDERSFVSFGEIKRYTVLVDMNLFVYADATDPTPLYTIPIGSLEAVEENSDRPHVHSHTVSPEANTGLPFANKSKPSLKTVLLLDGKGKIAFQITFDKLETDDEVVAKFVTAMQSAKAKESTKRREA